MRIATSTLFDSLERRIQQLTEGLNTVNEKLASQKKINRPSDDPLGAASAIGYRNLLSQVDQYGRNLNTGKSWMDTSESALSQSQDLVTRAKEIAVQMANGTQSAATRSNTATEVGHLLDQAISLGNTQVGGKYIFAGYRTGTTPFVKVNNGTIDTAQYNGDGNDFQVAIGQGETLTVGRNGQAVFMDSTLFATLGGLKLALETNDVTGIQQALTGLDGSLDHFNNQLADVGARANRLETRQGILQTMTLDFTDQLSLVEDADIAKMSIELKQVEMAYQSALLATSRVGNLSLTNYM
jgi:flagellar hook-associated protein 3 FlgL